MQNNSVIINKLIQQRRVLTVFMPNFMNFHGQLTKTNGIGIINPRIKSQVAVAVHTTTVNAQREYFKERSQQEQTFTELPDKVHAVQAALISN
jgi:hypothetical protein